MTPPKSNGRKYTLTKVGLAMTAVPLVGAFILAGLGKFTSELSATLSAIIPPYYLAVAGLVGAFQAANAYTTGKAADAGVLTPTSGDG